MTPLEVGFSGLGVLLILFMIRVPIGVALAGVSFAGIWIIRGDVPAIAILANLPYDFVSHWTLSAVPMFLFMGAIAAHTGLTASLYAALRLWVGAVPGGLAVATNFAGAGFAAASGSSLATTAAMGRIAVPEMLRLKYDPGLATGTAAAVGTLGALIPPSITMVIYAVFAEVSVAKMLLAGLIPGLLTAAAYALLIVIRCSLNPKLAPRIEFSQVTWAERFAVLKPVWPLPVLVIGVVGGIYSGIVTATEAGAFGVLLAILVSLVQRTLTRRALRESVLEAVRVTATIFFVAIGASLFTTFLALSQIPGFLSDAVVGWTDDPLMVILICTVIYIVLGCFLDAIGVLLLTLPILLPIFDAVQIDPIWIGVILVKYLEIGLLTPPVGLNVFVMKSVVGDEVPLLTIFKGVSWFLLAEIVVMLILIFVPQVILYLPSTIQ
ncbi:MAG: TRAP transporter large permease [Rhodobiaceae bacterium]|nr:TRAP transporter large permease [Rhodobiaceae bacterium]MCC0056255.1 TRAP transporter large permease [Rhodobiaceae bacterium]